MQAASALRNTLICASSPRPASLPLAHTVLPLIVNTGSPTKCGEPATANVVNKKSAINVNPRIRMKSPLMDHGHSEDRAMPPCFPVPPFYEPCLPRQAEPHLA